jgi:TonB-linked SusC/RagA family outer membrane protein
MQQFKNIKPKLMDRRILQFKIRPKGRLLHVPLILAAGICLILTLPLAAVGQTELSVKGVVTSQDDGSKVPGVNVIIKGTTIGTTTDAEGQYSLMVPSENAVLVFSFIGFTTQEIPVGSNTTIDIVLASDIGMLSEVVVVGYGTQKRSDITGSVVSISKDRLSNLPVTNVMQALQGTTAGLMVSQQSSIPGSTATIQVRGVNSINAKTDPFIVLDGVPFFGTTNDINANDIESIEILKDASAVAIYGTRGSNGVILITTKRGAQTDGTPTISYSGYVGVEDIAQPLTPMGQEAYVQKYADFLKANGLTQTSVLPNAAEIENYDAGITTDWLKEATRTGHLQEHNLSISGGTPKVQYYVSASRLNQSGVLKGYEFHRTSVRSNLDAQVTDYLKIGMSGFFTDNNNDGGRINFLEATAMSPYSVPYDADGKFIIYPMRPEQLFLNPLLGLSTERVDKSRNLTGNGYAEITPAFLKGFKYRLNGAYVYNIGRFAEYSGRQNNNQSGLASINNTETTNWVLENIFSYGRDFDKHHIDFTGLYSAQRVSYFKTEATSSGFINDALSYYEMLAGTSKSANSEGNEYSLLSQMGRINYSYDGRYLLTLTARRDGYSAFGDNSKKYGVFPSMALGWNIHNESFMSGSNIVNQLKLRVSYGKTGNQAIDVNQTATTAGTVQQPFGGTVQTGILYSTLGNAGLTWESMTSRNIGLDFGLLGNRITGTFEVYKSVTDDILLKRNVPTTSGYNTIWANLGKMQNVGIELTLNTVNIEAGDFKWETSLNFSTYKNKLLELYGDGKDDIGNSWFIGEPLRVVYGYEKIGIWQEADIGTYDAVAKAGDLKFKDQLTVDTNGDGKPDAGDGVINADDRVVVGQSDPKWYGGLTNTFHYKNFHLSVFLQTSQGGIKGNRDLSYADEAGRRNLPEGYGYWTPENKDNYWPSLSAYKNYRGYHFAEDWSYVRIKDVRLSYVVPGSFLDKYGVKKLTVYVAGRNLHTFTNWFGWDPEMTYYGRGVTDANDRSVPGGGSWRNNYPVTRTVSLGVNLSL